jgi:23S rRNA (adenine2503-C2)-methyltransferase
MAELGVKPYRAGQVFRAIHHGGARTFDEITTLPRSLRETLAGRFVLDRPKTAARVRSSDGTIRYLLALPGQHQVEAVAIPDQGRWTLCVSSQVGCSLGCTYCLTGRLGLTRHLLPGEIVGQVELLADELEIDPARVNVVFMGMGEPLHNFDGVAEAIRVLTDPEGTGLPPRRITVSTVGLPPQIERLAREPRPPRLAISLNATTDEVRGRLMPPARRYPLARLLEAARRYAGDGRDRITFEYVLLAGVNDTNDDARRLVRLLHGLRAKVNLIAFNPAPDLPFHRPTGKRIRAFRDLLVQRGRPASVRRSRGCDVGAACGQLAFSGAPVPGRATR